MSLLNPKSVAVIGASADEHKVGHLILNNLLTQGYRGKVFAVNPKGGTILDLTVFASVSDIPDPVDVAIIATPAATTPALADECGKNGVNTLVVISSGFREIGVDGRSIEEKLKRVVERHSMHLIGPNSLGYMRPSIGLNASFASRLPRAGSVALISQSGALGDAFIDRSASIGLTLSLFVSLGNKVTMDECDFLELCEQDPETKVIGLYLEGIVDGPRFLSLTERIGRTKPVILLKGGITEKGRVAASSHTGALAGTDAAVEAICEQAGILRARSTRQFLDLLRTISQQPPLLSDRIAIITNAGGPGVLATDAAEREGFVVPALSPEHASALEQQLPPSASVQNPIDVLGDALADRYEYALNTAAQDQSIDGALVILTPQIMTPAKEVAESVVRVKRRYPLFPVIGCFMGGEGVREAIAVLHAHGIPNFSCPESAMHVFSSLRPFKRRRHKERKITVNTKRAAKAGRIVARSGGLLNEKQTQELLSLYAIPLPQGRVAKTAEAAVQIAREIGYPVAAKVSSKDILHKTDVGGVIVHLATDAQVRAAFAKITKSVKSKAPKARVAGVLIQRSLPPGNEFIVGALKDETAGHLVMAGLGGIYTELFKDTSFRVAPVSVEQAYRMLTTLKSWKLLLGLRGTPQLAIDAIAELVSTVSRLTIECPQIREIDLNPVLLTAKDLTILDAKVVVGKQGESR
ncbi:MAG: acetate--CoA ligase family protein [Candidatus Peribacteraceae bacterium]|nr:acetate--CoA ligase family protein [Candidatus Peribacteraceae bacterium]MDD5742290.1 acetate--CoA ligase family protein [Candidatus Peribacteraceae bacterium]